MTDRELFVSTVIDLMKDKAPQFTLMDGYDKAPDEGAIIMPFYLWGRVGGEAPLVTSIHVVASGQEVVMNRGFINQFAAKKVATALRCYEYNKPADAVVITEDEAKRITIEMASAA